MALKIVNILDKGDATLRKVVRLVKLFTAYLLVLLNKYRGFINIPRVISEIYLGTVIVSAS